MVKIFNNKKAIATEMIVWILAIIFIGAVLVTTGIFIKNQNDMINKAAPEIQYQYPIVFLNTFLYQKIDNKDVENLGLDVLKTYRVSDLITIGDIDSMEIVERIKDNYLEKELEKDESLNFYFNLINQQIPKSKLIVFYEQESLDDILDCQADVQNYCFYLRTNRDVDFYTIIAFKEIERRNGNGLVNTLSKIGNNMGNNRGR